MPKGGKESSSPGWKRTLVRGLPTLAVVSSLLFALALAVRPLSSPDLGYHLTYGEQFLETGRIVDTNEFLYTLPTNPDERMPPGPACWYDQSGRYRFPNANWFSQVIFAAVYRAGGPVGLCALQGGLVFAIFAMMLLTMRRVGVPRTPIAAGILLAAMCGYMRFNLRPEILAYLILVSQLFILVQKRLTWWAVLGLVLLHLVLVNSHSYFLLGIALTGAFLTDRLLRLSWEKMLIRKAGERGPNISRDAMLLAAALVGQVVICFVNPWTWRLAGLPVQTLLFMREHGIAGADPFTMSHPWSHIGEFFRPFAGGFVEVRATYGYCVLLGLAGLGAVGAILRRRWDWLLIIAGMTAISLSMRRNITPAAFLLIPLALGACFAPATKVHDKLSKRLRENLSTLGASAVVLVSLWFALNVVTQRFYSTERSPTRFGVGLDRVNMPVGAAEWISQHIPPSRVWTDYGSSSNLHYFTDPHSAVPIMTNTWAYPPDVMKLVLDVSGGKTPFAPIAKRYGVQVVSLRVSFATAALVHFLQTEADWALVHLDPAYAIFQSRSAFDAALKVQTITESNFDTNAYISKLRSLDPAPAQALHIGGRTLFHLGWDSAAIRVFAAAVKDDPRFYEAWYMQGLCLARRGSGRFLQTGSKEDLLKAAKCFRKALRLKSDYEPARINLNVVSDQLRGLRRR